MNERLVDGDADLAALEDERDFLLSSLRDLDAEHDAGDIDDVDYETLRDDYTVRTAEVLRAIERARQPLPRPGRRRTAPPSNGRRSAGGPAAASASSSASATSVSATSVSAERADGDDPEADDADLAPAGASAGAGAGAGAAEAARLAKRTKTRWRLAAIVMTVLLFGAIAGWAVTATSGSRVAGQSITGDASLRSPTSSTPSAVESNLVKAAGLVTAGKVGDALKLYDQILQQSPNQPEAEANSGWLIAQTGLSVTPVRSDLVDEGLTRILAAEQAAPTYADPHFFRGYLLFKAKNDPAGAVTELRTFLGTVDPSSPEVPDVEAVLKAALAAAGPNASPGPNAPTTVPAAAASGSQPASSPSTPSTAKP